MLYWAPDTLWWFGGFECLAELQYVERNVIAKQLGQVRQGEANRLLYCGLQFA